MSHPENVKKQNKEKTTTTKWCGPLHSLFPLERLSLTHRASEALPFLPYVGHCVERLWMNTPHSQEVESREKNRLLIKAIRRLAQEKAIFKKKKRGSDLFWKRCTYLGIFHLPLGAASPSQALFVPRVNAMPPLLRQQFAFTNCVYKQHTLVNIVIVQGLYLVGFWITSFYPPPCVFMYSV